MLGRIVNPGASDVWTQARREAVDDDRLATAARLGDVEAFALLYQRYKLDVWQLAWFTLRDHHDAEDATQETFLKAHRALAQRRDHGSLRPWLLTICRNACRDRMRSARRRETLSLDEELAALAVPDGRLGGDAREGRIDFHRALAALPEDDREAFLLVDVLGCTSDEAARIAGVRAASTLRSRLARARRELAPEVAEPPDTVRGSEVWGVYHSAYLSALVVSEETAPGHDAHPAGTLLASLGAPVAASTDLVTFLERLDRRIPGDGAILAVVDDRPRGAAP